MAFQRGKEQIQAWQLDLLHALQRLGLSRGSTVSGGGGEGLERKARLMNGQQASKKSLGQSR